MDAITAAVELSALIFTIVAVVAAAGFATLVTVKVHRDLNR